MEALACVVLPGMEWPDRLSPANGGEPLPPRLSANRRAVSRRGFRQRSLSAVLLAGAWLVLLSPATAGAAGTAGLVFLAGFEEGMDGFSLASGKATVTRLTPSPFTGGGALRLELAPAAPHELARIVSPEFAVQPLHLYRLTLRRQGALGLDARFFLELKQGATWNPLAPTVVNGATFRFGTGSVAATARLAIQLQVPGQAIGRSLVLDDLCLAGEPALLASGPNLYWDGGFELSESAAEYTSWVKTPDKMEIVTGDAHSGRKLLRVTGDGTYIVFPSVPVQPRHVYRLRYWLRGPGGEAYPGMHKLAPVDWEGMRMDTAARVGWAAPANATVRLAADRWQCVEWEAACEGPEVVWFQPMLVLRAPSVDIDDVECLSIGPPPPTQPGKRSSPAKSR